LRPESFWVPAFLFVFFFIAYWKYAESALSEFAKKLDIRAKYFFLFVLQIKILVL